MKTTTVQCKNGEVFEVRGQNDNGVQFDGGTIRWSDVDGFWCCDKTSRRVFIPVE